MENNNKNSNYNDYDNNKGKNKPNCPQMSKWTSRTRRENNTMTKAHLLPIFPILPICFIKSLKFLLAPLRSQFIGQLFLLCKGHKLTRSKKFEAKTIVEILLMLSARTLMDKNHYVWYMNTWNLVLYPYLISNIYMIHLNLNFWHIPIYLFLCVCMFCEYPHHPWKNVIQKI